MIGGMAVILSDGNYGVQKRTHPFLRDAEGMPVPAEPGEVQGPWPGGSRREADGTYSIRLDPRCCPLYEGDLVTGPAGEVWLVEGLPQLRTNVASADLDHVALTGSIQPELTP
jgi:hypothetical protein